MKIIVMALLILNSSVALSETGAKIIAKQGNKTFEIVLDSKTKDYAFEIDYKVDFVHIELFPNDGAYLGPRIIFSSFCYLGDVEETKYLLRTLVRQASTDDEHGDIDAKLQSLELNPNGDIKLNVSLSDCCGELRVKYTFKSCKK